MPEHGRVGGGGGKGEEGMLHRSRFLLVLRMHRKRISLCLNTGKRTTGKADMIWQVTIIVCINQWERSCLLV